MSFFKVDGFALSVTVAIILLCTAVQVLPDSAQLLLRYQHDSLAGGELWRALSGHFLHLGWRHLILNAVAMLLLAALFEQAWRGWDVLLGSLFCAATITVGLYFYHPQVAWYVGYSGVLHGLFVIASVHMLSQQRLFAGLLLLGLIVKLAYESYAGSAQDPEWLGGAVVEQSHLWGAIGGAIFAAGMALRESALDRSNDQSP